MDLEKFTEPGNTNFGWNWHLNGLPHMDNTFLFVWLQLVELYWEGGGGCNPTCPLQLIRGPIGVIGNRN